MINEDTGHYIPVFRDPKNGMWYLYTFLGSTTDAERVAIKAEPLLRKLLTHQITAHHISVDDLTEPVESVPNDDIDDTFQCSVYDPHEYIDDSIVPADIYFFTPEQLDKFAKEEEHVFSGTKGQLGPAFKKLTRKQIHDRFGCIGFDPNCRVCQAVKRTNVRKFPETEPYRCPLAGKIWYLDMIKWNFPDEDGCTNSYVMRDDCTGYMDDLVLAIKSDFPRFITGVINKIRDKFQHRWKGHIIFAELHCDGAGELSSMRETALVSVFTFFESFVRSVIHDERGD